MPTNKSDVFSSALDKLIDQGTMLRMAMDYDCYPERFTKTAEDQFGEEQAARIITSIPSFVSDYQKWYS